MQIYVCVKNVPDSAANIAIVDNREIDDNVSFLLNPYDEHAVTEAVRIKKSLTECEIIVVCLGKEDAENTVRSALAMGGDRGLLIVSNAVHDSIETAQALKAAIKQDGTPGLILSGKESIDSEGMQTMFRMGVLFDFPVATNVVKLEILQDRAVVDSDRGGGTANTYDMSLPCVIGAGRGLNTPIYPTFPDVVKSKKKPVKKVEFSDLKLNTSLSGTRIVELVPLKQERTPREITGTTDEIAQKMVTILKQEAKVI